MEQSLSFRPLAEYSRGTLAALLDSSYAALIDACWQEEKKTWQQFDHEAFEHMDTIGHCTFISMVGEDVVGLASFDPRQKPQRGVIGQNCVLPQFRRMGIGARQVREVLRRFKQVGIIEAIVTTSEHPFFTAARRMYESCGFIEVQRYSGGPDARFRLIEYVRLLAQAANL